jgi:hypothetical protein
MLGCGTTNHLQSVSLTVAQQNGKAISGGGFVSLKGLGGTLQLQVLANYSGSGAKDVTNHVTYTMIADPLNNVDAFGFPLPAPPQTAQINATGLVTAVDPATCSWVDLSADPKAPAWFYSGDYKITASYNGFTSNPVFVPVASSAGSTTYNGIVNNASGACGP